MYEITITDLLKDSAVFLGRFGEEGWVYAMQTTRKDGPISCNQ